jgi:hypothetical protein
VICGEVLHNGDVPLSRGIVPREHFPLTLTLSLKGEGTVCARSFCGNPSPLRERGKSSPG